MFQILYEHSWYSIEWCSLIFTDSLQSFFRIKSFCDYCYLSSPNKCSKCSHDHSKTMIKRNRNSNIVYVCIPTLLPNKMGIIENIEVWKCGSFGSAGSTWSELNVCRAIFIYLLGQKFFASRLEEISKINKTWELSTVGIETYNCFKRRKFIRFEKVWIAFLYFRYYSFNNL